MAEVHHASWHLLRRPKVRRQPKRVTATRHGKYGVRLEVMELRIAAQLSKIQALDAAASAGVAGVSAGSPS